MFEAKNLNVLNKANNLIFVTNVNFKINSNEIWRLRGPNGIGKSSFYEALIGLREINQGEIILNSSITLNNLSSIKRIELGLKYIPQKNSFFQDLSVYNNLCIFAEYLVPKANEREDTINKAISTFQINEFVYKTPNQLSGGQLRLCELSKLMVGKCQLALIDEPFAALDIPTIENVCEIFIKLKEKGLSFLINDHNLKALESISDFDLAITKTNVKIISNH
ncbi:ATP-binding cassette domain-containing protein [Alphaproteobacteria bacterium endosymbiont of Tiliacea citrago]|uniref:ATP-binding cassette domain-containing protein n=1 Tax=Alphaproteobacteria bacterium endosymbiont of Tiliacea citrago TaxID=3077944 RepID=UPI00313DB1AD